MPFLTRPLINSEKDGKRRSKKEKRGKKKEKGGNVGDQQTSMGPCTRPFSLVHWTQFCFAFTNLPSERL